MNEGWFSAPVEVAVGIIGDIHHINNASQAVGLLSTHWPDPGTSKHVAAKWACLRVMHEGGQSENARAAFLEAAREARILVE